MTDQETSIQTLNKLCSHFKQSLVVTETKTRTNTMDFILGYTILNEVIGSISTAFSFVATDVSSKLSILQERHTDFYCDDSLLEDIIDNEINTKTVRTPTSAGRTLLRLVRALDFIQRILAGVDDSIKDFPTVVRESYEVTMKPHHSWIVKSAVAVAFYTLPSREQFLSSLSLSTDKQYFGEIVVVIGQLYQNLNNYYVANEITDLP